MDDLAPDVRQIISDRVKANEALTGDYDKDLAAGLVQEFKPTNYDFGLNAESDAIARKAKAKFLDPALQNLKVQQQTGYADKVQQKMRSTQQLSLSQYRYDTARALAAQQRAAQEESQRAAMIGSLFQVGGTIAGAYLGGPAGAAIGGAATGAATNSAAPYNRNPMGHSGPYMMNPRGLD